MDNRQTGDYARPVKPADGEEVRRSLAIQAVIYLALSAISLGLAIGFLTIFIVGFRDRESSQIRTFAGALALASTAGAGAAEMPWAARKSVRGDLNTP